MNAPIRLLLRLLAPIALGTAFALLPLGLTQHKAGGPWVFGPAAAYAKDGNDDSDDDRDIGDRIEDRQDERDDEEDDDDNSGPGSNNDSDDEDSGGRDNEDDDSSGSGNDDSDDDNGGNSGPGNGDDNGSDDNGGSNDNGNDNGSDDNSGNNDNGNDRPTANSGHDTSHTNLTTSDTDNGNSGRLRDITVTYPDGWVERIVNGHYELFDDQNRRVIRRAATQEDFDRMFALR